VSVAGGMGPTNGPLFHVGLVILPLFVDDVFEMFELPPTDNCDDAENQR